METTGTSSATLAKRAREDIEIEKKEVSQPSRLKATWEYLEDLKKLQSLEIEIEQLNRSLKLKEKRFPDLKNLRGTVEHLAEDRFWEVEIDNSRKILPGKTLKDAAERYSKKLETEKTNREKQKKKADEAKATKDNS